MNVRFITPFLLVSCLIGCSDDSSSSATDDFAESSTATQKEVSSSSEDANNSSEKSSSSADNSATNISSSSAPDSKDSLNNQDNPNTSENSDSKGLAANYNPETGILTDERDGEVYTTAKIGDQIWMGQNLRYLPTEPVEDCDIRWIDDREKSDSLDTYGRTYSWIEATRISCNYLTETISFGDENHPLPFKGICPEGWHIPNLDEWKILIESTDLYLFKLLSTDWTKPGYSGTNEYGFNVLSPANGTHVEFVMLDNAGSRSPTMVFNDIGGSTIQLETNQALKTAEDVYLRCLMD